MPLLVEHEEQIVLDLPILLLARREPAIGDVLAHLEAPEMLLYASDYPHWHFDGTDAFPAGFDDALKRRVAVDNPRAIYGRIS